MSVNIYVDEPMLSVAQFEIFMAKGKAGVPEERANAILKEDRTKLICRKLYGFATEQIKGQIMRGSTSGMIKKEGVTLNWKMDGDVSGLSAEEKEKVVSAALDGDWSEGPTLLSYQDFISQGTTPDWFGTKCYTC